MIVMRGKIGAATIPNLTQAETWASGVRTPTAWRFHPPANYGKWSIALTPATN